MNWFETIERLGERQCLARIQRIADWKRFPPHKKIVVDESTIGFWRIEGGVLQIEANVRGEFDPARGILHTNDVALAIVQVYSCAPIK